MPYKDPEKQKAAQKAWYERNKNLTLERSNKSRDNRKQIIRDIKESSPCVDCKIPYPYYVMHFDHLDSAEKLNTISILLNIASIKSVLNEIEKCDLVCANCHSIRTWKRQHGIRL
jgi:hypothetical protein